MNKLCKKCQTEKPLAEFYGCKSNRDGKAGSCKDCAKKRESSYRNTPAFLEAERKRGAKRYSDVRGRAQHLLHRAKHSKDGCTLTAQDVITGIERGSCPVTGVPFDLRKASRHSRNPFAPSLDRINPKLGYTPENTRVVIWHYNAMKGELSDREVLEICRKIVARVAV